MGTQCFDNSSLSQESFAIDTWRAVICSLGHDRKHMLTILLTIWRPCFNKVKAFEPVPLSADRIVLRSYQPATILSVSVTVSFYSVTVSFYSIEPRPSNLTDVFYF